MKTNAREDGENRRERAGAQTQQGSSSWYRLPAWCRYLYLLTETTTDSPRRQKQSHPCVPPITGCAAVETRNTDSPRMQPCLPERGEGGSWPTQALTLNLAEPQQILPQSPREQKMALPGQQTTSGPRNRPRNPLWVWVRWKEVGKPPQASCRATWHAGKTLSPKGKESHALQPDSFRLVN